MASDSHRQLVLRPADISWQPDNRQAWLDQLRQLGFLGEQVDTRHHDRFCIGEHFLQLLSFMGCSPAVEFSPANGLDIDWHQFIYIYVPEALADTRWLADQQTARPACPACNKRTRDWLGKVTNAGDILQCPACDGSAPVCEWNWYDGGGCATQFICVVNVYPREAIPSDHFLNRLASISEVAWRYFYIDSPLIEP